MSDWVEWLKRLQRRNCRTSRQRGKDRPIQRSFQSYFLPFAPDFGARWLSAEAAAVFDALLVRPSRSTFEAALAAFALVFLPAITITSFRHLRSGLEAPPLRLSILFVSS
ncbi:hypothetical protein PT015_24290 [Candidatus Mycobacterium wuenschmannii]|uniref:Uncharacterized protein n=1 Tax=Candidatus Mycobacterium wuenschmannii TaxID=3027808 RepID=A0ABY8VYM8_9MYCO|nr:hypothetical protein [Candidatus Mycobacterium wuenschmannii]WIM87899.1 hypothetical protein PT015_24290 [Candidatus Mycobacterium wuenschmannii]